MKFFDSEMFVVALIVFALLYLLVHVVLFLFK